MVRGGIQEQEEGPFYVKYCPSIFRGVGWDGVRDTAICSRLYTICSKARRKVHRGTSDSSGADGECFLADGNCIAWSCMGTEYGIAKGGACEPFDPTSESGLECIEDFEKKTLQLTQYFARCDNSESCRCVWDDTGESKNEEVCNCKD